MRSIEKGARFQKLISGRDALRGHCRVSVVFKQERLDGTPVEFERVLLETITETSRYFGF